MSATRDLAFHVLGPVGVSRDGERVEVGGAKARAVLAMLILDANRMVSSNRLLEGVWGDDPPDGAKASLQVHVYNLRKALGPEVVETVAPGYVLRVEADQVDLLRFEALVTTARELLAAGDNESAADHLARALEQWTGPPIGNLMDLPFAPQAASWLSERRSLAAEQHIEALLESGRHGEVVPLIDGLIREHPHRERLWAQLMLALYRGGRQADALTVYQRARRLLADDLGIEPGPELRDLERRVLAQAPDLDRPIDGDPVGVPASLVPDAGPTYRVAVHARCHLHLDGIREIPLDGLTTVGRNADCEVSLSDVAVSRRHAELRPALGGHLLVDLGSTNGTKVNGEVVVNHLLRDGDRIEIGTHVLEYRVDETGA